MVNPLVSYLIDSHTLMENLFKQMTVTRIIQLARQNVTPKHECEYLSKSIDDIIIINQIKLGYMGLETILATNDP